MRLEYQYEYEAHVPGSSAGVASPGMTSAAEKSRLAGTGMRKM